MLETQRVLDEADVRPKFFFLLFFLSPLPLFNFLLVLFQLGGDLLQLRVTQGLVPDVQQQARLEAAVQHRLRPGEVARGGAVAHRSDPGLPEQPPVGVQEHGRNAVLQLQHGGADHAQDLQPSPVEGSDPLEGGGVRQ